MARCKCLLSDSVLDRTLYRKQYKHFLQLGAGYESGSVSFIDARGSNRDQPPETRNTFGLANGAITKVWGRKEL